MAYDKATGAYKAVRNPAQYMKDNRGEHQSVTDQLVGNNKWKPNSTSEEGSNPYTDSPDRTVGPR